jgi:hypothetical protein
MPEITTRKEVAILTPFPIITGLISPIVGYVNKIPTDYVTQWL